MPPAYIHRRRVEFTDVDMGGVMHFSNYFRFMESAEHAFFRSVDVHPFARRNDGTVAWPRVRATCAYHAPLHLDDDVDVHVLVASRRRRSIELWMALYRGEERVALGAFRNVCALLDCINGSMKSMDIPPHVEARIQIATPDDLAAWPSPWR